MKKLIFLVIAIGFAWGAYKLASPLFITNQVNEKIEDISKIDRGADLPEVVAKGAFQGLGAHNAAGTAELLRSGDKFFVRLDDDFSVTNGPDLFVYLGKDGRYVAETQLGALKGNVGGQNYEIPSGINPADYNEVWVWCRAFSVGFAKAVLES